MYFAESNSDQPICMYELGRNLVRMQDRFPDEVRSIISVEDEYSRKEDVIIQSRLTETRICLNTDNVSPELHAKYIYDTYSSLIASKYKQEYELDGLY